MANTKSQTGTRTQSFYVSRHLLDLTPPDSIGHGSKTRRQIELQRAHLLLQLRLSNASIEAKRCPACNHLGMMPDSRGCYCIYCLHRMDRVGGPVLELGQVKGAIK